MPANLAWLWCHQSRMVPTPWRAWRLKTISLSTSRNTDLRGGTLEELMRSRGSMTGILSRGLFSGVTLAIDGTVNAAVRFLGLAVRATAARPCCVSQTMRHKIGHAPLSFLTGSCSSSWLDEVSMPPATMRGAYPLLPLRARVCGVVIARMAARYA